VHALILFLILAPIVGSSDFTRPDVLGGGGPGPAGGGGGGSAAGGSHVERIEFVRVKSDPTVMPKVTPATVPPVKPKEPKPQVETPVTPSQQVVTAPVTAATGTGTGTQGTPGAGPGTGGGVGSGEGTGRGSSVGPGTGGGPGKDYPPTVRDLFIPPMPAPSAVKGFHMKAFFDVDEKGNAKLLGFNPTRDGDYNKRVTEVLKAMRFRPGVHADGTPMRDTAEIEIIF
jgi:periplasmic protein TonB